MKALIINGSPNKKGATSIIIDLIEEKLKREYEVEKINAYDLNIKPCLGCLKCRANNKCVLPNDDGHNIGDKLLNANLITIGTPCYWGNIPAPLKVIFDRNVTAFERFIGGFPHPKMKGKKAIIIVTSGSGFLKSMLPTESRGAVRAVKTVLKSGGIKIVKIINVHSSWNIDKYIDRVKKKINRI